MPRHVAALGFITLVGLIMGLAVWSALDFSRDARTAPLVVGIPTLAAIAAQVVRDVLRVRRGDTSVGQTSDQEADRYSQEEPEKVPTTGVEEQADGTLIAAGAELATKDRNTNLPIAGLWVITLAALTYFLGMLISIPLFIALFMRVFGRERWHTVVLYAGGMTGAVYFLFVYLLGVRLYQGMFGGLLPWP
ncbi:tripartite tricarboxylate transporter TctB family protein [Egicoccus sp. AB-alg2]|uniref:tripartite tricarboxylate transporter TctB family protein n=1 Tax=Egicoccus sp. AB-alg2 TaxID=3242693 RepID=UPI00359E59FD